MFWKWYNGGLLGEILAENEMCSSIFSYKVVFFYLLYAAGQIIIFLIYEKHKDIMK